MSSLIHKCVAFKTFLCFLFIFCKAIGLHSFTEYLEVGDKTIMLEIKY